MKITTLRDKQIYNKAVRDVCNEILKYDGIIPQNVDRVYMSQMIEEKISYKIKPAKKSKRPKRKKK